MKDEVRMKYKSGDPVPWFFTTPTKPAKAPTANDGEKNAIVSKLKSSGMLAELKKANNLPASGSHETKEIHVKPYIFC